MAYKSINPVTGETVAEFASHRDAEIERFLAQSHEIYKSEWSQGPIERRLNVLSRLADLIESRSDELAKVAVQEMGKRISEARGEVEQIAKISRHFADHAAKMLAPEKIETDKGDAWLEYHPIGVIVAIEPWNFPYYQLIRVAAPAIAAGNPVLVKPASIVPKSAKLIEELILEAGAPKGAWTTLFASSDQIAALLQDDRVQGVTLTGSERAGSIVAAEAGRNLKKSVLELGGSDVFAVLDDADLDRAVDVGAASRLAVAGQVCIAAKRFIVHEKVAERFIEKLEQKFSVMRIGDPMDETVDLGPLSSVAARDSLAEQVRKAVAAGAQLRYGGNPLSAQGAYFEPTILTNIARDNPAYFEEFFGPVAQIHIVRDDDALVALANDSPYGLGGTIFSSDIARAKALASRIETGMVWINAMTASGPELPFGGVKRSGYGREMAESGIKELVNQKLVLVGPSQEVA
ncbi:NAD-dependent succinate-semialdehyde dehydrogenase [Agrobacterium sp. B1(2019)]|jgi:succinate-semialdehyde dehydrogenase/glutarate-semialdehyde dehydrogenase|uniref:NAD-dependent succinate-semialdehyde dehydrogenase n=1 Tax=Agrobacterium sp. B1(2019) TaxID=2607032 RepID=UPI0011EF664A|nr:NAD-dependent succinate-semialdehyde dehydrogenase [Agrobacterium sp. B1(2019)]TZG31239.1 NAD-dependent succinate-semialdehyde dehydrogenase [Agrobacterium sp. B1(2019)]